jgi:hypothetical protein
MPGDYTDAEVSAMNTNQLVEALNRNWQKPTSEINLGTSMPTAAPVPRDDVWATKVRSDGMEFVAPSGQKCLLREVTPDRLLEAGILDKVTRLEGLAEELIRKSAGLPPEKQAMPSREELGALLEVVNALMPIAVLKPTVYLDGDIEAPEGAIFASDIDLEDRLAIMAEALKSVRKLDPFRDLGQSV